MFCHEGSGACQHPNVWRQRAALGPLWCPQPTFRFEGHKGDIRVRRTEQAGELINDTRA